MKSKIHDNHSCTEQTPDHFEDFCIGQEDFLANRNNRESQKENCLSFPNLEETTEKSNRKKSYFVEGKF